MTITESNEKIKVIVTDIDGAWYLYDENGMGVETEDAFFDYEDAEMWALNNGYEVVD